MTKKVLIATLYSPEPTILSVTKLGPEKLILLIDKEPNEVQQKSLELIKGSIGKVLDVKAIKTEVLDIVKVASKCVEIIDLQSREDEIYVNITSGRKTKSLGLLFAAYARNDCMKKIVYFPQEDKNEIIYLPRMSFKLTSSQKQILEYLAAENFDSITELSKKVDLSTAMLYRTIDELRDMDFVAQDKLEITDAGKIARL